MKLKYTTIKAVSEGYYESKGSKFIAYAYPSSSEEVVKTHLKEIKALHPKSRHLCYAFRVGENTVIERVNDDGEPSGSAGQPILRQLYSFGVDNVLVGVIRYFGGTKLGVSGLISAYKLAAQDALQQADIIEVEIKKQYQVICDYATYPHLMELLKRSSGISLVEQELLAICSLTIAVTKSAELELLDKLEELELIELNKL